MTEPKRGDPARLDGSVLCAQQRRRSESTCGNRQPAGVRSEGRRRWGGYEIRLRRRL